MTEDDVADRIATRPSSTLFGISPKLGPLSIPLDYEVYDPFVVRRDVERIERLYRSRGFYDARANGARVVRLRENRVRVEVTVDEGEPVLVGRVVLERKTPLSRRALAKFARAQRTLKVGARFDEETYDQLKQQLLDALTEGGHAYASIEGGFRESDLTPDGSNPVLLDPLRDWDRVQKLLEKEQAEAPPPRNTPSSRESNGPKLVSADEAKERRYGVRIDAVFHNAQVYLVVNPGPECVFGRIQIEGLGNLPEARIRDTIDIREGSLYSSTDLDEARNALLALGLFSSVTYKQELTSNQSRTIAVTFRFGQAPLQTSSLGGGLQVGVLQTDVHLLGSYEHANFLGGLRKLTMQVRPGVVLFPSNLQNLLFPERLLPQVQSKVEIRQPDFLEARTSGTTRTEFSVYPFLLPIPAKSEVPDVVVGYREVRQTVGVDRPFFDRHLSLGAFYNIQISYPFTYLGPQDDGIRRVLISHLAFLQTVDLRDNPIKPRRGFYFTNELQAAGGFLSGDADDVRIQPDARFYAPISRRVTLATRGSVGFLFPRSYGNTLDQTQPDPTTAPAQSRQFETERNRDLQILFFRAFFSGGPNSNRGYALRGIGPRGVAPFNLGRGTGLRDCVGRVAGGSGVSGTAAQIAKLPAVDPNTCGVPLGGLSLWESSLELRYQIGEKLGTSVFLDASDVTRERLTIRFDAPHLSTGLGLRYDTPVGPIRLDVGYAIPGLQRIGRPLDPYTEGTPATLLGIPLAINIAVGEAF